MVAVLKTWRAYTLAEKVLYGGIFLGAAVGSIWLTPWMFDHLT